MLSLGGDRLTHSLSPWHNEVMARYPIYALHIVKLIPNDP